MVYFELIEFGWSKNIDSSDTRSHGAIASIEKPYRSADLVLTRQHRTFPSYFRSDRSPLFLDVAFHYRLIHEPLNQLSHISQYHNYEELETFSKTYIMMCCASYAAEMEYMRPRNTILSASHLTIFHIPIIINSLITPEEIQIQFISIFSHLTEKHICSIEFIEHVIWMSIPNPLGSERSFRRKAKKKWRIANYTY